MGIRTTPRVPSSLITICTAVTVICLGLVAGQMDWADDDDDPGKFVFLSLQPDPQGLKLCLPPLNSDNDDMTTSSPLDNNNPSRSNILLFATRSARLLFPVHESIYGSTPRGAAAAVVAVVLEVGSISSSVFSSVELVLGVIPAIHPQLTFTRAAAAGWLAISMPFPNLFAVVIECIEGKSFQQHQQNPRTYAGGWRWAVWCDTFERTRCQINKILRFNGFPVNHVDVPMITTQKTKSSRFQCNSPPFRESDPVRRRCCSAPAIAFSLLHRRRDVNVMWFDVMCVCGCVFWDMLQVKEME